MPQGTPKTETAPSTENLVEEAANKISATEQPPQLLGQESIAEVETYEEFLQEDAKLERFLDRIEQISPGGKIDIFNPDFWPAYRAFTRKVWEEEYLPSLGEIEEEYFKKSGSMRPSDTEKEKQWVKDLVRREYLLDQAFSGGARIFGNDEHLARIKSRTLIHMAQARGDISADALQLLETSLPDYYRPEGAYGPRNIRPEALNITFQKRLEAATKLEAHLDFPQVKEVVNRYTTLHELYEKAWRLDFPDAAVILDKAKDDPSNLFQDLAEAARGKVGLENRYINVNETEILASEDEKTIQSVIEAGIQTTLQFDGLLLPKEGWRANLFLHRVTLDANAYSDILLSDIKPAAIQREQDEVSTQYSKRWRKKHS